MTVQFEDERWYLNKDWLKRKRPIVEEEVVPLDYIVNANGETFYESKLIPVGEDVVYLKGELKNGERRICRFYQDEINRGEIALLGMSPSSLLSVIAGVSSRMVTWKPTRRNEKN